MYYWVLAARGAIRSDGEREYCRRGKTTVGGALRFTVDYVEGVV